MFDDPKCPACGDELYLWDDCPPDDQEHQIACPECGAELLVTGTAHISWSALPAPPQGDTEVGS
jgi:DNA-directed RNA polymerase subunit RPC12/RpoP